MHLGIMYDSKFIKSQLYVRYVGPEAKSVSTDVDQDCGTNREGLIFEIGSIHWRSRGQNKYRVNNLQISCTPNAGEAEPKYFEIFLKLFDLRLLAKPSQTCNFGLPRR
jgi:hypothetical protein